MSGTELAGDSRVAADVGMPLTGHERNGRGCHGVQNGEASLATSLASLESLVVVNSGRLGPSLS
jgi:hypothetical protein